jgi:hypothetical protein
MCNWACASIKVLQVLGNTIRGLSMANWRIVTSQQGRSPDVGFGLDWSVTKH